MIKSDKLKIRTSKISGKPRPIALISISLYPPYTGGGPTYFSTLVELLKDKVDFLVLTQSCKGERIIQKNDNVWIYRVQPYVQWYPSVIKYLYIVPITLLALLYFWVKYKPALHAHSSGIYGFGISLFSTMFQAEMLKDVQDLRDPGFNLKFGKVKRYIACGGAVEDKLKSLGLPNELIMKYPAINPPAAEEIKKKILVQDRKYKTKSDQKTVDNIVRLSFIGWLDRIDKGVDVLLNAFEIVTKTRQDITLSLVGDGPDRKFCEEFIKEHQLKNVHILGRLDYEATLKQIYNSDIIVIPSKLEAQGRAITEGYLFSKPAIGTKIGGIPELIKDGETGILVEPENPQELAKAILKLAGDKELRLRLGKNGSKFLESMPTWQNLAEDIYHEYVEMCKK